MGRRGSILEGTAEPRSLGEQSRMIRGTYAPRDAARSDTGGLAGTVNRAVQRATQSPATLAGMEARAAKAKKR